MKALVYMSVLDHVGEGLGITIYYYTVRRKTLVRTSSLSLSLLTYLTYPTYPSIYCTLLDLYLSLLSTSTSLIPVDT